jgi:hypothetical protein
VRTEPDLEEIVFVISKGISPSRRQGPGDRPACSFEADDEEALSPIAVDGPGQEGPALGSGLRTMGDDPIMDGDINNITDRDLVGSRKGSPGVGPDRLS